MPEQFFINAAHQQTEPHPNIRLSNLSSSASKTDKIFRMKDGRVVASTSTGRFTKPLVEIIQRHEVLKKAFRNLWRKDLYNREYISFLLGAYTDEEFMEIARKYATQHDQIDEEELLSAFKVLSSIIEPPITSFELGYLLNADCSDIDRKMVSALGEDDR